MGNYVLNSEGKPVWLREPTPPPPPPLPLALYEGVLDGLQITQHLREQLWDGLCQGRTEAEAALLVVLSPNLRRFAVLLVSDTTLEGFLPLAVCHADWAPRLSTIISHRSVEKLLGVEKSSAGERQHGVENHKEVTMQHNIEPLLDGNVVYQALHKLERLEIVEYGRQGVEVEELAPLVKLPLLQSLIIDGTACCGNSKPSWVSTRIQRLELRNSVVDASGLERLLQSLPELVSLTIDASAMLHACVKHSPGFVELGDVVCRNASKLTSLCFSPSKEEREEAGNKRPVRTLASLTSLKHLEIPLEALVQCKHPLLRNNDRARRDIGDPYAPVSKLPTSLESLDLGGFWDVIWDPAHAAMQVLVLMRDPRFERLKTIRIQDRATARPEISGLPWRLTVEMVERDEGVIPSVLIYDRMTPVEEAEDDPIVVTIRD